LGVFFEKIASVDVRPKDPKDKRAMTSTNDSFGVNFPAENKETNNEMTKEITQIIPVNLLDDNVVVPDPNKDLKNFFIVQFLTFLVCISYNDLL